jgi:hypothetical protein
MPIEPTVEWLLRFAEGSNLQKAKRQHCWANSGHMVLTVRNGGQWLLGRREKEEGSSRCPPRSPCAAACWPLQPLRTTVHNSIACSSAVLLHVQGGFRRNKEGRGVLGMESKIYNVGEKGSGQRQRAAAQATAAALLRCCGQQTTQKGENVSRTK